MKPIVILVLFVASLILAALIKIWFLPDFVYFWFFEVPILFSVSLGLALGFGRTPMKDGGYLFLYTILVSVLWNIVILMGLSVDSGGGVLYGLDILVPASLQLFLTVTVLVVGGDILDTQMFVWHTKGNRVLTVVLQAFLVVAFSTGLIYFLTWITP